MMTPCSIGLHNWEIFNNNLKVKLKLIEYLKENGFERYRTQYSDRFTNGNISIISFGFYNDDTLEGCIPYSCQTKVCVDCGKIKLTYDMDKCIVKLQNIIKEKTAEYEKTEKAKKILDGTWR